MGDIAIDILVIKNAIICFLRIFFHTAHLVQTKQSLCYGDQTTDVHTSILFFVNTHIVTRIYLTRINDCDSSRWVRHIGRRQGRRRRRRRWRRAARPLGAAGAADRGFGDRAHPAAAHVQLPQPHAAPAPTPSPPTCHHSTSSL